MPALVAIRFNAAMKEKYQAFIAAENRQKSHRHHAKARYNRKRISVG